MTSPSFNARFASIEIDTPGLALSVKSPRKVYPANLFPQNYNSNFTTPPRVPVLSTAKRAQSRTSSLPKKEVVSPPVAPKRLLKSIIRSESQADSPSSGRRARPKPTPTFESSKFSFMKETSSSRKKHTEPLHTPLPPRSVSHSEIYSKRPHPPTFASKKRVTRVKPTDITNKYEPALPFAHKPTMFSNTSPSRHTSQAYTTKAKEDVYTRLYKSAAKTRNRIETRASRTYTPAPPIPPLHVLQKPRTNGEMYKLIHAAEPRLFEELNLEPAAPNTALTSTELLNSPQGSSLSIYERGEIMRRTSLYYIPSSQRPINISSFRNNYGFDDNDGNYVIVPHDHVEYRYEIIKVLGTGSFGNVVLCTDHKYSDQDKKRKVAIKLIRNELDWSLQAVSEIKMLKHLQGESKMNEYIMNYHDHFHFRGHMCIVTEVLSLNLYTFLEIQSFRGIGLPLLKKFAFQILSGLKYIHDKKIIHCDIKPENIMIKLPATYDPAGESEFSVKIIDFGASSFENETAFSYIQSRFYRAPEVILGAKYSYGIDVWSFGCVIAELFSGSPLLPGKTEIEQIGLILEIFGAPPSRLIVNERKKLMRSLRSGRLDPLVSDPSAYLQKNVVDERKIKKTLLYSLFNLEGKINVTFLNLQLQGGAQSAPSPFRKNIKLNSRSFEVALKLHGSNEDPSDVQNFIKFMNKVFSWDPQERALPEILLQSPFLLS